MGSQYERQLIIEFLGGKDKTVIENGSMALCKKFKAFRGVETPIITIDTLRPDSDKAYRKRLGDEISRLKGHCRIYLNGHGSVKGGTLSGMTAKQVAELLLVPWPIDDDGKPLIKIHRISLVACRLARATRSKAAPEVASDCLSSFAGQLFEQLGPECVETLTARVHTMTVVSKFTGSRPDGTWILAKAPATNPGQKISFPKGVVDKKLTVEDVASSTHKGNKTKVLFYWDAGKPQAEFYTYGKYELNPAEAVDNPHYFKLPDIDDLGGHNDDPHDSLFGQ